MTHDFRVIEHLGFGHAVVVLMIAESDVPTVRRAMARLPTVRGSLHIEIADHGSSRYRRLTDAEAAEEDNKPADQPVDVRATEDVGDAPA